MTSDLDMEQDYSGREETGKARGKKTSK